MIWIINSDVQIFQIYGHTTRIPDFRVIGPSEIRLKSDMSDSPDFYSSEIRGDRFTDFCVHTTRFSGNRLQKVGRLEKIGQWDHGIRYCHAHSIIVSSDFLLFHCYYSTMLSYRLLPSNDTSLVPEGNISFFPSWI